MTASRVRPRGSDEGSITLFFCIAVVGLLVMVGLVVDGGAKVRALQRADRLAAEAGRAGGQAIDVSAAIAGDAPTIDRQAAVLASQAYLRANGVTGTVAVTDAGRALVVDVTTTTATVFLGLIGVKTLTVHGSAKVVLVRGVSGPGR